MSTPDWGAGAYEQIAPDVYPGAEQLVAAVGIQPGERVLDVGCGTGSAAVLAARAGGDVVAIDPSSRLLDLARATSDAEGLRIEFRQGGAPGIPVADGSQDVVLSNFAVIFSPDPRAAVADLVRVLRPGGRIAFTAWVPGGTVDEMIGVGMRMMGNAMSTQGQPPERFPWHDTDAVRDLFAATGAGLDVRTAASELAFVDVSPESYLDRQRQHPMSVLAWQPFEQAGGDLGPVREAMLAVLTAGNEDPSAFRATAHYVVHTAS